MSVDFQLYIPPHVKYDMVINLCAKITADPGIEKVFLRDGNLDAEPSEDNPWYYRYNPEISRLDSTMGFGVVYFKLGSNKRDIRFCFHTDNSHEELSGYKLIMGRAEPVALAVASRLLDIVGGYLFHADCGEMGLDNTHEYRAVIAPVLQKDFFKGESTEQFYRFAQLLRDTRPVSLEDLNAEGASYELYDKDIEILKNIQNNWMIEVEKRVLNVAVPNDTNIKKSSYKL